MKLFYLLFFLCTTAYADQCDDLIDQWNENECCGLDGGICSQLKQYAENCNCQSLQAVVDTTPSGACSTNPCFNSAICDNVGSDSYTCTCVAGYDGNNCENDIDDCASNPCVNATYCEDLVNDYNCACNPGYEGKNCSTEIDECAVNPCVNGVCTDLFNDYSCSCYAGWEGDNCDIDIDDCANGLCGSNEYTCVDGNQTHTCDCTGTDSMGEFCNVTIVSSVEQDITIQVTAEQENNVDFILGLQCSVADAYGVTCDACAGGDIVDNTATCDAVSVQFGETIQVTFDNIDYNVCENDIAMVTFNGLHNIIEVQENEYDDLTVITGTSIHGEEQPNTVKVIENLYASSGQTRYFKCSLHPEARFKIGELYGDSGSTKEREEEDYSQFSE